LDDIASEEENAKNIIYRSSSDFNSSRQNSIPNVPQVNKPKIPIVKSERDRNTNFVKLLPNNDKKLVKDKDSFLKC